MTEDGGFMDINDMTPEQIDTLNHNLDWAQRNAKLMTSVMMLHILEDDDCTGKLCSPVDIQSYFYVLSQDGPNELALLAEILLRQLSEQMLMRMDTEERHKFQLQMRGELN